MSSVNEIVSAIEQLSPAEFEKLKARMDRIAERMWEKEHRAATARFRKSRLTDADIDRIILRRRYRGRRP